MKPLLLCALLLQGCAYNADWRTRDVWSDGHGTVQASYFTTPLLDPTEPMDDAWAVADNACKRAGYDTAYVLSRPRQQCGKATLSGCAIMFVSRDFKCKNVEHRTYATSCPIPTNTD